MINFKYLQKLFFLLVMGFSLSLLCVACGDDEDSESVTDPSKNTTDIAVTGKVEKYGCTYACISGYANLNLLPAGTGNPEIGIELLLADSGEVDADKEITDAMTGNRFMVRFDDLYPDSEYKYRSFVKYGGLTHYGEYRTFTTKEFEIVQSGAVDLGLSVKWAAYNIGASKPEEYGDYFAWGETKPKSSYDSDNSTTYGFSTSELESRGIIGSDGNLTASYDAATANWGSSWRMPTSDEIEELVKNCYRKWITYNGVNGQLVTGSNGISIFLPATGYRDGTDLYYAGGYGYCWSATPNSGSDSAYNLFFTSDYYDWRYSLRHIGRAVRPVLK